MTAQKFKHVPNEIMTIQFTGDNAAEILEFFGDEGIVAYADQLNLTTTHGDIAPARSGDWIVPDSKPGTFYPIKDEVLLDTYLPVGPELVKKNLTIDWPRLVDGDPVTADMLKKAWGEFMVPLQEAGRGSETNIKVLLTIYRNVYGGMQN